MDHFLQMSNSVGKYCDAGEMEKKYLAPLPDEEKGGLFLNDTWEIFITKRRFSPNPIGKIEIWRK